MFTTERARVDRCDPESPGAQAMLEAATADLRGRYPRGDISQADYHDFRPPRGEFFVAFFGGAPVGCCGLSMHRLGGEIKRMFVSDSARRKGVATTLIRAVEAQARIWGLSRIVLETGTAQPEAMAFYAARGYVGRNRYPPYERWVQSRCFERSLGHAFHSAATSFTEERAGSHGAAGPTRPSRHSAHSLVRGSFAVPRELVSADGESPIVGSEEWSADSASSC
jgi:GNAT superfamily N-acetyltransferase